MWVVTAAVSRILQYHEIPGTPAVLALREGSILRVVGDRAELVGTFHARSAALYNIQTEKAFTVAISFLSLAHDYIYYLIWLLLGCLSPARRPGSFLLVMTSASS